MNRTDLVLQLLLSALSQTAAIGALLNRVKAEGRDVTEEELNGLTAQDDAARQALADAIAKAKSG